MIEFAVHVEGEEAGKGRWVLAVDSVGERLLIAHDDQTLTWVPMNQCKCVKAANPELPRPVVVVQTVQAGPKLTMPALQINGQIRSLR